MGEINKTIAGFWEFDCKDMIYAGHFPGKPVVPGSLVIGQFISEAKELGYFKKKYRVKRFKFKKFIEPGVYQFNMKINCESIACRLFVKAEADVKPLVTGTIEINKNGFA